MSILKRRSQVAAKIEAVEGTPETLLAADAFLVFQPTADPDIQRYKRDPARETLGQMESLPGERSGKITLTCELAGSGTAGTAPFWGKLMKACGFAETIVGGTSVAYTPASAGIPSMSLALYMDGIIKKIWGARGDVFLTLDKGKPGLLKFTFTGADFTLVDGALLVGVSYSVIKPPVFLGAQFAYDTYAANISKLEINQGNAVQLRDDVSAASGYKSALITNREPKVSFDPEAVTVATKDFFGKWRGSDGCAMSFQIGATPGNIVAVSAPKAQIEDLKLADRKEIRTFGISAGLKMNTGDDDWTILLT